jgi:hypothetical protein
MRVECAVAAFVLIGGLVGCGADSEPAHGPSPTVDEAIARTEAATTARYAVTIVAGGAGSPVSVRATGSFDRQQGAFSLVTDVSTIEPDLDGRLTIVATANQLFVDCPSLAGLLQVATRWIGVRGAAGDAIRASVFDPLRVLATARRSVSSAGADVEVDVGADGLVRRVTMRFDAPRSRSAATLSVEFFDVGKPVDIRPPAAEQVTDETDALNRLLGGSTGG